MEGSGTDADAATPYWRWSTSIPPLVLLMEMLPIPVALNTPKKRSSLDGRLWAPAKTGNFPDGVTGTNYGADLRWAGLRLHRALLSPRNHGCR